MTDSHIIKGYKGIMDLDLRDIPEKYHKEMIENHEKELEWFEKAKRKAFK
jgi:hypothetical protein